MRVTLDAGIFTVTTASTAPVKLKYSDLLRASELPKPTYDEFILVTEGRNLDAVKSYKRRNQDVCLEDCKTVLSAVLVRWGLCFDYHTNR